VDEGDLSLIIGDVRVIGCKFGLGDVFNEFPRDLGSFIWEILWIIVLIVIPLYCVIDDWGPSSGFKLINFTPLYYCLIMIHLNEYQRSHLLWYGISENLCQWRACPHTHTVLCADSIIKEFISAKMTILIDCMLKC
jgi:hypothetical protein